MKTPTAMKISLAVQIWNDGISLQCITTRIQAWMNRNNISLPWTVNPQFLMTVHGPYNGRGFHLVIYIMCLVLTKRSKGWTSGQESVFVWHTLMCRSSERTLDLSGTIYQGSHHNSSLLRNHSPPTILSRVSVINVYMTAKACAISKANSGKQVLMEVLFAACHGPKTFM